MRMQAESLQRKLSDTLFTPSMSLQSFRQQLQDVLDAVIDVDKSGRLDSQMGEMAFAVGDYATSLLTGLLNLHISGSSIMKNVPESVAQVSRETSPFHAQEDKIHPVYIGPAYSWLVNHLHNPYPTTTYRDRLAKESHCRRRDIDNWFKVVRRKIGWTMIREAHFKKRRDMIDSAARYFVKPDPERPLDGKIIREFELMRVKVKEMYSFHPTELATCINEERCHPTPQQLPKQHQQIIPSDQLTSRHSEESSSPPCTASHSPRKLFALISSGQDLDQNRNKQPRFPSQNAIPPVTGKRRTRDDTEDEGEGEPCKHIRLHEPSPSSANGTGTVSPSTSPEPSDNISQPRSPLFSILPTTVSSTPSNARKRRLSETDFQVSAKRRLLDAPYGPILRSISDTSTNLADGALSYAGQMFVPSSPTIVDSSGGSTPSVDPPSPPPLPSSDFNNPSPSLVQPPNISDEEWQTLTTYTSFDTKDHWVSEISFPGTGSDDSYIDIIQSAVAPLYNAVTLVV